MSFFDMTSDADVEDDLDRVETDVVVDCDIEAAWALVSEPGWWVNDGPLGDHEVPDEYATRIEISLSEERGGVAIHVEESGLASVSDDEAEARQAYEDEVGMWEQVLSAAKNYLEGR